MNGLFDSINHLLHFIGADQKVAAVLRQVSGNLQYRFDAFISTATANWFNHGNQI